MSRLGTQFDADQGNIFIACVNALPHGDKGPFLSRLLLCPQFSYLASFFRRLAAFPFVPSLSLHHLVNQRRKGGKRNCSALEKAKAKYDDDDVMCTHRLD